MLLRRCPSCGRRVLRASSFFQNPYRLQVQCDYCGTEYRLRKKFVHILLLLLVWFAAFIVFIAIDVFGDTVLVKTMLSVVLFTAVFYVSSHTGALRKYNTIETSRFSLIKARATKDLRFKRKHKNKNKKAAA